MIPKSTSYKLKHKGKVIDAGSKKDMQRKAKKLKGATVAYDPSKPIVINQPLSTLDQKSLDFIKQQFAGQAATQDDIDAANNKPRRERKTYEHFSTDGKGNTHKVDPKPKTGLFKTRSEGRIKGVMPTKKTPKLKLELWNGNTMLHFFRTNGIHADRTDGWFITFNTPSRKMTAGDQLELFLAHGETEYEVQINRTHKHLVIDSLEGNPPA